MNDLLPRKAPLSPLVALLPKAVEVFEIDEHSVYRLQSKRLGRQYQGLSGEMDF